MRWKSERPSQGDIKFKRNRFLWFPKKIGNEVRWLEKASWSDQYHYNWSEGYWISEKWLSNKGV